MKAVELVTCLWEDIFKYVRRIHMSKRIVRLPVGQNPEHISLFWIIFPDNDAALVIDNHGHPLAYFDNHANIGISPVPGFDGKLPDYFDGINYETEELNLVERQIDLLLNWEGWKADNFEEMLTSYAEDHPTLDIRSALKFLADIVNDCKSMKSSKSVLVFEFTFDGWGSPVQCNFYTEIGGDESFTAGNTFTLSIPEEVKEVSHLLNAGLASYNKKVTEQKDKQPN